MSLKLKMWSYDLAREQAPTLENVQELCRMSLESGFNALGLYVEHRFDFPFLTSYPNSKLIGPAEISELEKEFPDLMIMPMVNVLGHMEGFLRMEEFHHLSEERFKGLQACPSLPETQQLAAKIVESAISAFRSPIIHIGGDETAALGKCSLCRKRVEEFEQKAGVDGKANLYSEFYKPLFELVTQKGRRAAIWGDMALEHPQILEHIPKTTLIFDWQYRNSPLETSKKIMGAGFPVVTCPALHAYNAAWLHLPESQQNLADHIEAGQTLGTEGICFTTWEPALFGMFETWIPAIRSGGRQLNGEQTTLADGYDAEGAGEWVTVMAKLAETAPSFHFSGIRSGVKCRFLLYSNPFLLWLRNPDLSGPEGEAARQLMIEAERVAPNSAYRGVSEWIRMAIEFCQHVQAASLLYHIGNLGSCVTELGMCRQIFEALERIAQGASARFGGSRADVARCQAAKSHIEVVIRRIRDFGDGSLGYRPSFEHLCHPKFMAYDQGAWWLINSWANE